MTGWVGLVSKALPGLLIAAFGSGLTFAGIVTGFLWRQTITLAEMNKTLTIVCEELKAGELTDRRQDEAIHNLRIDVEGLKPLIKR